MRRAIMIVTAYMLLTLAAVGAGFTVSVVLIDRQVATNRHATLVNRANGAITRSLVCEPLRYDRLPLPDRGCP